MALKEKLIDKAQKLVQKGYLDKAIAEYRAAVDTDPRDVSIRLKIGDLFVKLGRKEEAIKEYTEVAKANAQRGFYLKAIAVYKQILKLDDSIEVHNKLAELYTKQRLIADAISEYSYIVTYFERRGKSAEVLDLLKKMVEVDPDNTGVRLKLAEIYQRMSFDKDAMAEYSLIFDRLVSQGKLDRAEKMYQGLHNSSPANEQVIAGLAEVYRLKGDNAQRVKFLKALLRSYNASARTEDAKKTALTISEISPNDPDAAVFLKKMEEDGWAGQGTKAVPQAGAAVEATSGEAELVSWPEEEITVPVEAVTEAESRQTATALEPEFEADAAIEPAPPAAETPDEPTASVSDAYEPPAAGVEAGPGEVEIDIQDLLNGELPSAAGAEGLETPPAVGAPAVQETADSAPEAGPEITSEIEIEVEAEPEETLPSGGPVEAGADEGIGEEEIEIEMMEAGIEEAAVEEAATLKRRRFPEPSGCSA
ncbi:MAG: tetratricopeptide repeat protein [Deltaproteobacteria bacterium]|nr:tetratricopeptide repeat protein [Deltaproteobacteria bacterium]